MLGVSKSTGHHTELNHSRIQKDEESVATVVNLLTEWMNSFEESQSLISVSTARVAPRNIADDLLNASTIGELVYAAFKNERLENDPPEKKFHDPLKTQKLKTFSSLTKKKEVRTQGRLTILKADRSLFGRIVVMAQGRNLQMSDIFSYPLGPLSWALSTPDGLLRKTNKSALATAIQKNVYVAEQLPNNSATVIDGMNLVQKVKGGQETFGDVASTVLAMALNSGANSNRIDVVFDTYVKHSIKDGERDLRGREDSHQFQTITSSQILRQWRGFLSKGNNKNNLITFMVNEWRKDEYRDRLKGKILHATTNEKCSRITSNDENDEQKLMCMQEEADGRILLHAAHAAKKGYSTVHICSEEKTQIFSSWHYLFKKRFVLQCIRDVVQNSHKTC